jgi:hypothetical protein
MADARQSHDICHCGDYRSQHDEEGCTICRWSSAPWDGCRTFRLARPASRSERRHWTMSQPGPVQISEYQLRHFRPHYGR